MSMGNPFAWPPNANAMNAGAAAMVEAHASARRASANATTLPPWPHFSRIGSPRPLNSSPAFEKALEVLVAKYPTDDEAKILYALVLNVTALPTDKSFTNQLKAGAILEPLFKKYPNHPGVAHYLIHTYDYAELAERGLPAARAYTMIAPARRALHMPSTSSAGWACGRKWWR